MAENVFEAVKQSVSTREAAAFYGIEVKRNGMACCPFHDDKNPSMKVDQRFHCFGCGADGDVIDFTAKLFDLSPKEAAEKLAQDFGLIYDSQAPPRRRYVRQKTEAQKFREDRQRCYRILSDYYYLLKKWEADNSPQTPEEEPHPRFVEAIQKKTYVEYLLDLFLYESEEEQKAWITEHTAEITHLERRLKIMAENKPTNRERLREITDGIEQGIKELFESEKYMRYLSVMSRFHRYSVNNTMLIYMQKPDATLVAGYNKWKDQFERHVKKGEHGITIIAPTPYKKKIEEQKLDPDTKAPILDKDGKIVTEEKEIEIPMFRPVKVFDVSQTDGKPLPELASSLSGNVPNYEAFMEALRRSAPVPITIEAMAADTDGYFSADHQKIAVRQGMSEVQTVSATVHEIAHSKLHDPKKYEVLPSWKVVLGADANQQEALFLIDDATYLHIQPCDNGWDYTLYDAASMKEMDGGQLDMPELSRMKAVLQICDDNDLDSTSLRHAPLSMIETLQEAAYEQMQAEASQMAASSQLPEAQEQALDEYPMPDEQVSTPDMQEYGYSYDGMLPVTRERALELDAAGLTVYVLYEDNTESMVFDPQEIMDHGGLFGVDHEEWEKSPQFHEKVMERQEHQQEREQAFLSQNRDCFAIYQVSRDDPQNVRFMNLDWLKSHNISIDRSNYDLIYTAPLRESGTVPEQLEKLYQQFNLEKSVDFHSPSMSVSDIVAVRQDGKVSCHYCDSVGFTQIPGFLPENPLKNAEMMLEDDYGMIDGIINNGAKEPTVAELEQQARSGQPISLMDLANAVHREEREKKKSVVDQLKSQPKAEHKKTAPKKSAEREI